MTVQQVLVRGLELPWRTKGFKIRVLASQSSRPRVLVAEEDDDLRALVRDELDREGLEVVGCASAREVVRRSEWIHAMAGDPWSLDVVVADMRLGEIDGLALLQRVAEAGVDVPFVLISASGDVRVRARASELGAAAFLEKPPQMERLRGLVHQLARERQRRIRTSVQGARPRRWRRLGR